MKVDRLFEVDADRYSKYLKDQVYPKMARYTTVDDHVTEICTRHDRGVISRGIIPHRIWTNIDRSRQRPGLNIDVLTDPIPECDVIISTAILHHTNPEDIPYLIDMLCDAARRMIILSGPNAKYVPELIGDHLYHLVPNEITRYADDNFFSLVKSHRIGLSAPLSGVMLVYSRD